MTLLYERYPEDEILTVICKMLMRGQITTKDAFVWYERGVNHNLKITELYEYYMYSIDEKETMAFTHSVLLYFLYDNHLTVDKRRCYMLTLCGKRTKIRRHMNLIAH